MQPHRPNGPLFVPADSIIPEPQRGAEVRNVPELYQMVAPQLALVLGIVLFIGILAAALVRAVVRRSSR
jgi:hypothetical protein